MKFLVLIASVLIELCLGGMYAWSAFVPALKVTHKVSTAQAQVIFSTVYLMFVLGTLAAGRLQERWGPRIVSIAGGLFFGAGFLLASRSADSYALLLAGVGLVAGLGLSLAYVCPIATSVRWFPQHKGLVTGLCVAGYGIGAVVLSNLAEQMMRRGINVLEVFRWVGMIYGSTIILAAMAMVLPAGGIAKNAYQGPRINALLREHTFWALIVGIFCGTFGGMAVVTNLKPIAMSAGVTPLLAGAIISAFAVGNAVGRISWGMLADRIGQKVMPISLTWLAAAIVTILLADKASGLFAAAVATAFGYGAASVVYAAEIGRRYGAAAVGAIFPFVLVSHGTAAIIAAPAAGLSYDLLGNYRFAIIGCSIIAAVGAVITYLLRARGQASRQSSGH